MASREIRLLMVLALVFGAFGRFLTNPFVFDDVPVIRENLWLTWEQIPMFFKSFLFEPSLSFSGYRPLPLSIFAALRETFGPEPFYFRLFNLFVHLCNGLLALKVAEKMLPKSDSQTRFFLVILFLLHPVQSNLIALAWNLCDLLFITGSLISIWMLLSRRYLLSFLGVLLAILSKENALILPPALFLIQLLRPHPNKMERKAYIFQVGLLGLFLAHVWIIFRVQPEVLSSSGFQLRSDHPPSLRYAWSDYLLVQLAALPEYVRLMVFPLFLRPYHLVSSNIVHLISGVLILIVLLGSIFATYKRNAHVSLLLTMGTCFLLPGALKTLALPFDEDRISFSILFFLLTLGALGSAERKSRIFVFLIGAVFLFQNLHQARVWSSPKTLWTHNVELEPEDPRAHLAYGLTLKTTHERQEAVNAFAKAAILDPSFSRAHMELARILLDEGYVQRASQALDKASKEPSIEWEVLMLRGIIAGKEGREAEAENLFKQSIRKNAWPDQAYQNLAVLYQKQRKYKEAISILKAAQERGPEDPRTKEMLEVFQKIQTNSPKEP